MATLAVRSLEDDVVRRLRIRAAEHGRSAETERRAILRSVLVGNDERAQRERVTEWLAEFRRRTAGRGLPAVTDLLHASRAERLARLAGDSHDNALAEAIHRRGPWRSFAAV